MTGVKCPACARAMNQVTARANPGSLIQLDQCAQCGGIWCDKWELFPIQPDEAQRLEPVDEELLRSPAPVRKKTLYCPRCTARLATARDPTLPADIQLQRCPKCQGIWLNRGQLSRYKRHQQKTRDAKMGGADVVRRLGEVYSDPKSWIVTGTQGMFAYPSGQDADGDVVGTTLGGAFRIALQALLRMILGV